MPVEIPDSRIHDLCFGCKQWFFPEEGMAIELRKKTGVGRLQRVGDLWTGVDRSQRFLCFACQERRRRKKRNMAIIALVLVFMLFIAAVTFVYLSGILDKL